MKTRYPLTLCLAQITALALLTSTTLVTAQTTGKKPNILVLWGDDIGNDDNTNGIHYKVHLDGYDQSQFLTSVEGTVGKNNGAKSARKTFLYTDDDSDLMAFREGDYKYLFEEQRSPGTMQVWAEPFTKLRLQKIYNLYQDPYERSDITSNTFWDWQINHVGLMYGVMAEIADFAMTFKEYPPRSIPPSFKPATIMDQTIKGIETKRKLETAFPMLKDETAK